MNSEINMNRITISPDICHGKPCIRGMRWPVEVILDMLGSGMSIEQILLEHPELEKEDFLAIFQFLKILSSGNFLKDVA
ncbi:MAG: DUF433 domain-containing protein [Leptospiraceae bacterium]|nr:DUF433 domain-containing protein [Leptospiraceae bacterium]